MIEHPDIVFLDLELPDGHGCDALVQLKDARPSLPVVVISADESLETVGRCLDLRAMGYVPKSSSPEVLHAAIVAVLFRRRVPARGEHRRFEARNRHRRGTGMRTRKSPVERRRRILGTLRASGSRPGSTKRSRGSDAVFLPKPSRPRWGSKTSRCANTPVICSRTLTCGAALSSS
jgi:DNA-binding NtrC family response regulator